MTSLPAFAVRAARRLLGPFVPSRLDLRFRHRLALLSEAEPELRFLARLGPNRGTAVDVGANEGLFTYALSRLYEAVHAFEINPDLAGYLRSRTTANVTVHSLGLSSASGTANLYIPLVRGRALTGWASLEPGNCPDAEGHLERPVEFRPLDSLGLTGITFIKADVEGHEPQFLAGAIETIRRDHPVILIEVKDRNRVAVHDYFDRLGYCHRRLSELVGEGGSVENAIFIPRV